MTPTIDQIEAALPYVPAGIHCGDLTEPDERREFAEVIHGIVVAAGGDDGNDLLGLAELIYLYGDRQMQRNMTTEQRRLVGRLVRESSETAPESRLSDAQGSSAPRVPGNEDGRNNGVSSWPPPKPDMTIAWGISEALIEEAR